MQVLPPTHVPMTGVGLGLYDTPSMMATQQSYGHYAKSGGGGGLIPSNGVRRSSGILEARNRRLKEMETRKRTLSNGSSSASKERENAFIVAHRLDNIVSSAMVRLLRYMGEKAKGLPIEVCDSYKAVASNLAFNKEAGCLLSQELLDVVISELRNHGTVFPFDGPEDNNNNKTGSMDGGPDAGAGKSSKKAKRTDKE